MIDPTETSRLRVIRMTAWAAATIIRIAALERIALKFSGVRNCGLRSAKPAPRRMRKANTPLTRKRSANWPRDRCGPSTGSAPISADIGEIPRVSRSGHHDGRLIGGLRVEFGDKFPFRDDENAIADREHLRKIR